MSRATHSIFGLFAALLLTACDGEVSVRTDLLRPTLEFAQSLSSPFAIDYEHTATAAPTETLVLGTGDAKRWNGQRKDRFFQVVGDQLQGQFQMTVTEDRSDSRQATVVVRLAIDDHVAGETFKVHLNRRMEAEFTKGTWPGLLQGDTVELRLTSSGARAFERALGEFVTAVHGVHLRSVGRTLPPEVRIEPPRTVERECDGVLVLEGTRERMTWRLPYCELESQSNIEEGSKR